MMDIRAEMWERAKERMWNDAVAYASRGEWISGLFDLNWELERRAIYG